MQAASLSSNMSVQSNNQRVALINLGVNGFGAVTEAAWKADMLNIIDTIRARWPQVQVYIAKPWKVGFDAQANTFAGWIDDIVAARSFTFAGPDERVWLKGSDNGATMTTDGIHYSTAGQIESASQWLAVLP